MASTFGTPEIAHAHLGETTYDIVPQPLPYLEDKLGGLLERLQTEGVNISTDAGITGLLGAIAGGAHALLLVFIPDLMPVHKWHGYRTAEDMEAKAPRDDEFVRAVAPTGPQVKLAIGECFRVNGLDMWDSLKSLVDPTLLQAMVTEAIETSMREARSQGTDSQTRSLASTPA